jgi:glycerol-3-phosphate dehydrogenase (NAD(P)+)
VEKISILGAGAFGFAMAKIVSENHKDKEIFLSEPKDKFIKHISETGMHPIFHEDTELPEHVIATTDLKSAVQDSDLIILAMPSRCMRGAVSELKPFLTKDTIFLNIAKGLEDKTNMRVSEIIDEELKENNIKYEICSLSGGMIAREVTLENPLCADLGCNSIATAEKVRKMLYNHHFRVEITDDILGIELTGAFKNVIAIGAGMFDGLGYAESSKSAFVSAAAKEMRSLAIAMGAKADTFGPGSQAWFGDLMTTCFGASRNRELGRMIGKGRNVQDAVAEMRNSNKSVEGYITTHVVRNLVDKYNVDAPLLNSVHDVLYNNHNPKAFIRNFIKSW